MVEPIVMTALLTWGSETLETPRFGDVDASINQQTITFSYNDVVVGVQDMSISPDIGPNFKESDVFIGYNVEPVTLYAGDGMWGATFVYPFTENVYATGSYIDRDKVDRGTVGIGYQFSENFSVQLNYGVSDYATGIDSTFTAGTLVFKY